MKMKNNKVAFVDYDGVVNCPIWNDKGTSSRYNFPSDWKVNNFQAVQWLSEFCKKCKYDIVVTSTWRSHANYKECLINGGLREGIQILGKTDDLCYDHPWPEPTRGYEIKKYLEEHPEIQYYIIIDDENQFLDEQQQHFVKIINDWTGFGYLEMQKCIDIYMKDLGHQSSFWTDTDESVEEDSMQVDSHRYLGLTEPIEEIIFITKNTRQHCDPDYILDHDSFKLNGVEFRKVKDDV